MIAVTSTRIQHRMRIRSQFHGHSQTRRITAGADERTNLWGVHPIVRSGPKRHISYCIMSDVVLEITNLTRRFGAFTAVDALTLSVNAGEVFGLLGSMPGWLKTISHLNPLTYVVDALRTFMLAGSKSTFGLSLDYAVILLTTAILVFIGARLYPRLAT
jgi:hypothetical protein